MPAGHRSPAAFLPPVRPTNITRDVREWVMRNRLLLGEAIYETSLLFRIVHRHLGERSRSGSDPKGLEGFQGFRPAGIGPSAGGDSRRGCRNGASFTLQ